MHQNKNLPIHYFPDWIKRQAGRRLFDVVGLAVYILAVLGPVVWLGVQAVLQAGNFGWLLNVRTARLLGNSLALGTVVMVCSTLLGLGLALWLVSRSGWLTGLMRKFYLAPFILPTYIYAITWMGLLSRSGVIAPFLERLLGRSPSSYGFGGVVVILSLAFAPLVTLLASSLILWIWL
jgi:iron(III) transport system permease protein